MHESQSRFYENILGRSEAFWKPIFPRLAELFPEQLGIVELPRFIQAVNQARPGLIRIEADELTYCLHIMVRYELEKELIGGTIEVEELPEEWASRYEEYLGIRLGSDRDATGEDFDPKYYVEYLKEKFGK